MPIPVPTLRPIPVPTLRPILGPMVRRCVMLGLALLCFVALADGVARIELAQAVNATLGEGLRVVAQATGVDD